MPTISTSTTITVPANQKLVISGAGATATATVNPGSLAQIYDVGVGQDILGPFDRSTPVRVDILAGSVTYNTVSETAVNAISNGSQITDVKGQPVGGGGVVAAAKFRAGFERARSGGLPLLILMAGDSNTSGAGAGDNSAGGAAGLTGAQRWSVGRQLADILDRTFMHTTSDAFMCDQNCTQGGVSVQAFDPRFSAFGAGWSQDSTPSSLGGRMFVGASGGAGALTFTPVRPWNRVRLLFGSNAATATAVTVKAGATTIGTVNTRSAGSQRVDTTVSTGAAATVQSFSLDTVTGGAAFLYGAIFWDSNNPGCVVVPAGWFGSRWTDLNNTTNPWSYQPAAAALGADLIICNETINDGNNALSASALQSSVQTFFGAVTSADVILSGCTPSSASTANGVLDGYKTALVAAQSAISSPFAVVDWRDQFGSTYAAANASGWMYDTDHLKGIGYARQAAIYAAQIRSVIQ